MNGPARYWCRKSLWLTMTPKNGVYFDAQNSREYSRKKHLKKMLYFDAFSAPKWLPAPVLPAPSTRRNGFWPSFLYGKRSWPFVVFSNRFFLRPRSSVSLRPLITAMFFWKALYSGCHNKRPRWKMGSILITLNRHFIVAKTTQKKGVFWSLNWWAFIMTIRVGKRSNAGAALSALKRVRASSCSTGSTPAR